MNRFCIALWDAKQDTIVPVLKANSLDKELFEKRDMLYDRNNPLAIYVVAHIVHDVQGNEVVGSAITKQSFNENNFLQELSSFNS